MSIIKKAWDAVASCGGWQSVYGYYPALMQATKAGLPQVSCPFTGQGKTKFRLYKDWNESGAGYHNDFGHIASGIDMVMLLEPDYCQGRAGMAAKKIVELLKGTSSATRSPVAVSSKIPTVSDEDLNKRRGTRDALLKRALPSAGHWLYKAYCKSRGVAPIPCDDLLVARGVYHRDEYGNKSYKNAILGVMRKPNGEVLTVHRLYLDEKGNGIKGENRKMLLSPPCQKGEVLGSAIRLAAPRKGPRGNVLGLTEGIETGLAVMQGADLPVWSCYSTALLEAVVIPDEVEKVVIFADYDYKGGAGLDSAEVLAARLRKEGKYVRIVVPKEPPGFNPEGKKGVDWLDVFNCSRTEFRKQVRECLSLEL